ncbi:MAG: histidinol dehydrogenase, partial [Actinomycetota bacterium]
MSVLRRLTWSDLDAVARRALLDRDIDRSVSPPLREQIAALVLDVRERGDAAVCDALSRFDRVDVTPDRLRVSEDERERARGDVADHVRVAIRDMVDHIRRFNEAQRERLGDWSFESEPGLVVGEKVTPIASAGLFCPSGKASYPSVLAQLGGPAVVARVPEIRVVVPPKPGANGAVDSVVLAVADELGLADVYRANGP